MKFEVGHNFINKVSKDRYEVYDITGQGGAIPAETPTLFLKKISSSKFFGVNGQQFVTITGREVYNYFDHVRV
tara:strand:+ start:917 stop:1135 length:219 start_codon:yes stop_codon:yes gene_type:complete